MSSKRRTKIAIMMDVLKIVRSRESVKKTEIVYGANLNFERASGILKWLIEKDLVKAKSDRYEITEKGEEILREFDELVTFFR